MAVIVILSLLNTVHLQYWIFITSDSRAGMLTLLTLFLLLERGRWIVVEKMLKITQISTGILSFEYYVIVTTYTILWLPDYLYPADIVFVQEWWFQGVGWRILEFFCTTWFIIC